MSPIAVGLDIFLVILLLAALGVGLRLNRRLKALREGQASFVRAVTELDAAARRADEGLKALKAASEDTHDLLLARIETARGLIARLENASGAAAALAPAPAASAAPAPASRPIAPRRPAEADDDLFEAAPADSIRAGGGFR